MERSGLDERARFVFCTSDERNASSYKEKDSECFPYYSRRDGNNKQTSKEIHGRISSLTVCSAYRAVSAAVVPVISGQYRQIRW